MSEKETNYVENLLTQLENELNEDNLPEDINTLLRKCSLNLVTVVSLPDMDVKPLLATIKRFLTPNQFICTQPFQRFFDCCNELIILHFLIK